MTAKTEDNFAAFSEATLEVISTMAGLEVTAEGFSEYCAHDRTWGDVTGLVGLPGQIVNGFMSISFEKECILAIVSGLIGETHEDINSSVSDAVGELTNMVSSVARVKLSKLGVELGMALPFTVIGKGVGVDTALTGKGRSSIFQTKFGAMQLAVILADSKTK